MKCETCQIEIESRGDPLSIKDKLIVFTMLVVALLIWISAIYGLIKYLE